jgi:nicotinate-nucleotide pyrophosphorylase (carboxylating)
LEECTILLDNLIIKWQEKLWLYRRFCLTESSGNIDEETIRKYADCGVNYISSGALTHSVYNMDLSLKAI